MKVVTNLTVLQMYYITSLKRVEEKRNNLRNFENSAFSGTLRPETNELYINTVL